MPLDRRPGSRGRGDTFEGCNRLSWVGTWWSRGTVTQCEPGRSFAFVIGKDAARPNSEWLYTFESLPNGSTLVTESYRMVREPLVVRCYYRAVRRARQIENGVATTLDRLQWAAEMPRSARHHPASRPRSGHGMVREPGRAVSADTAWDEVEHGRARILDLRSRFERAVWGYPPGSKKVSFLAHAFRPDHNAIYLCQHALRSKWLRYKGAREIENGFRGWVDAGLPIQRRSLRG